MIMALVQVLEDKNGDLSIGVKSKCDTCMNREFNIDTKESFCELGIIKKELSKVKLSYCREYLNDYADVPVEDDPYFPFEDDPELYNSL